MEKLFDIQFDEEHKAWQRTLEFLKQECALLKYRLSEMLDNLDDKEFLQSAEYFQNELLLKEEKLKSLLVEIDEFYKGEMTKKEMIHRQEHLISKQSRIRNDIFRFEINFLSLSSEFNKRMLQSI